jgi:hypothetical protein
MLSTAGGLYFAQLSVKIYGGRPTNFRIDVDEDKMFDEVKITATLWIPTTGMILVSAQDKQKLYLVNPNTQKKEAIVPSQPFVSNVISLNILDEHLALVRDGKFVYVVDTLKKKAFRVFESSY